MSQTHDQLIGNLAAAIEIVLKELYGQRTGFALVTFPFDGKGEVGDWISNGKRDDMIKFMREIATRIERNDPSIIPRTIGSA